MFYWVTSKLSPQWKDVEAAMNRLSDQKLYDAQTNATTLYKQLGYVKNYCTEQKIAEWREIDGVIDGWKVSIICSIKVANIKKSPEWLNMLCACRQHLHQLKEFSPPWTSRGLKRKLDWILKHLQQYWWSNSICSSLALNSTNIRKISHYCFEKSLPLINTRVPQLKKWKSIR